MSRKTCMNCINSIKISEIESICNLRRSCLNKSEYVKKIVPTEAKSDKGKPRCDLVSPSLIEAVGYIRGYGVEKYKDPDNWKQVEPNRYVAALLRHLCEYMRDPNSVDEESGLPHIWHCACNINFLTEFYEMENNK